MEDRSSMAEPGAIEVALSGKVGEALPRVRLTAAAAALLEHSRQLRWVVERVEQLRLPEDEFEVQVGVKVERRHGRRHWRGLDLELRFLPPAMVGDADRAAMSERPEAGLAKVGVRLAAVELLVTWKSSREDGFDVTVPAAFPAAFPASVIEDDGQNEAAWRSKVRWLMAELVLARYGLDSYREHR
jgi:hypothetical protein